MSRQRILLVDDATETRIFLADSILSPEGYEVITAADGVEALKIVYEWKPDLIIADYLMPQMTGLDLLAALKNDGVEVPFILITAEGSEALAVRAMRLGVRDYFIKPFDVADLIHAVARILDDGPAQPQKDDTDARNLLQMFWLAADVILATDNENRILFYNKAAREALGFSDQTVSGRSLHEIVTHSDILALFDGDTPDNTRHEIAISNELILNAQLSLVSGFGKVAVMQDITRLKEIDRTKSEFITAISHDLRSPLTTILGYVELLERTGDLNDQQRKFTENIIFSVRSITALLADLLELNKIETGFMTVLEPTKMEIIARYAIETHRATFESKDQHLNVDIQSDISQVLGNPIRLKQMASNLLQNASKYTPPEGRIDVRLYEDDGFIIFQVSDNGIGIPLEDQPHIWDKFYRTEAATNAYPGTGLGLSIVKSIVEAHAGRIWMESTPGQGATFTVMLPPNDQNATQKT